MPNATHIALTVCTIGKTLENLSKKYVKNDDALMGIMLDGIGSAAVDCLLEEVSHDISNRSAEMGLMSSSPVSPGMPGMPLETQKILFDMLPAEKIAVRLTRHNMIIPFKSSSMIMGIGHEMPKWSKKEVCRTCHLFLHCRYKLE
jgi:cobalamin-dependent methionine synthase I